MDKKEENNVYGDTTQAAPSHWVPMAELYRLAGVSWRTGRAAMVALGLHPRRDPGDRRAWLCDPEWAAQLTQWALTH